MYRNLLLLLSGAVISNVAGVGYSDDALSHNSRNYPCQTPPIPSFLSFARNATPIVHVGELALRRHRSMANFPHSQSTTRRSTCDQANECGRYFHKFTNAGGSHDCWPSSSNTRLWSSHQYMALYQTKRLRVRFAPP
jgi:hypothetical protein